MEPLDLPDNVDQVEYMLMQLATVSDSARNILDSRSYILSTTSDTPSAILPIAIEGVLMDLADCGFFIHADTPIESYLTYSRYLHALMYVFGTTKWLSDVYKTEDTFNLALNDVDILHLADDEEGVLPRYIEIMQSVSTKPHPILALAIEGLEHLDWHYNTTFLRHIADLIDTFFDEMSYMDTQYSSFNMELDQDALNAFFVVMVDNRTRFSECLEKAISVYPKLDADKLRKDAREYDLEKTLPENINTFATILTTSMDATSGTMKRMYDAVIESHMKNNPHHIEYYYERNISQLSHTEVVELVAHHIEPNTTKEEQLDEIASMIQNDLKRRGAKALFVPGLVKFAKALTKLYISNYEEQIDAVFNRLTR